MADVAQVNSSRKSWKEDLAFFAAVIAAVQTVLGAFGWFLSHILHVDILQFILPYISAIAPPNMSFAEICVRLALIVQAGTIMALAWKPKLPTCTASTPKNAIESSEQLLDSWLNAWLTWFVLYVLLTFEEFNILPKALWVHVARDACNLVNACFLFLCYRTMTTRTSGPDYKKHSERTKQLLLAAAVLTILEYVSAAPFPLDSSAAKTIHLYYDTFNGLISGVAIALFVGRFAGGLIDAPIYVLVPLFAYANIQILFPFLESNYEIRLALITVAFACKILLFWQIYKLATSGKLIAYMAEYRAIITDKPRISVVA